MADQTPTILQIVPRLDTGGAELSTLEIVDALVRAGARALVATEGGRMAERVTALGGEIIVLPLESKNPVTIIANGQRLARLVHARSVALLHARSRAPAWSALMAARRTGVPFVTTYHGAYGERGRLKRFYNSVMARGDVVIANSRYTADLIRSRYGALAGTPRIIPRGVDIARFSRCGKLRRSGASSSTRHASRHGKASAFSSKPSDVFMPRGVSETAFSCSQAMPKGATTMPKACGAWPEISVSQTACVSSAMSRTLPRPLPLRT
jgi:glycosyltransferase involved in cell wall biosynthesis